MLTELHVRDLGVIEEIRLDLSGGMTALSGETGAGKTLIVEALELLLGGRADSSLVRPGAAEAIVEGRFATGDGDADGDGELILARAVPREGRSRAWVDGRMAPVSALAEVGARLVDLHGQHAQQSLLDPGAQRNALDAFASVDLRPLRRARESVAALSRELDALGGDDRARAREADLLRYQIREIEEARIEGPDEDAKLAAEEERLAQMAAHRESASSALQALEDEGSGAGAVDLVGRAHAAMDRSAPLAPTARRIASVQAELADIASELRRVVETWEEDPERLAAVQARRQLLRDLSRKYGEGAGEVLSFAVRARERLEELDDSEKRAAQLGAQLEAARGELSRAEAEVGGERRGGAPGLAQAVQGRLRTLAMPHATVGVSVADLDPGDEVSFELSANPGEPALPLSKVASGGELSRAMLALRLVLTNAPPTMVFDEVDAGVGGEAATALGAALAELSAANGHQVIVVTHLAQVAAFARRQVGVTKEFVAGRTVTRVRELEGEERVAELARMLSGRPGSATARRHAEELLRSDGGPTAAGRDGGPTGSRRGEGGSTRPRRASSTVE